MKKLTLVLAFLAFTLIGKAQGVIMSNPFANSQIQLNDIKMNLTNGGGAKVTMTLLGTLGLPYKMGASIPQLVIAIPEKAMGLLTNGTYLFTLKNVTVSAVDYYMTSGKIMVDVEVSAAQMSYQATPN